MDKYTPTKTIDEVISQMDKIIERCVREKSRLGYFAVLYRDVTIQVKEKIKKGFFENGPRMEKLDVVFANRYLKAIHQYWNGEKPRTSWLVAFDAAKNDELLVLQHLLLGMNAHINLDLGIASAQIAPGKSLTGLHKDFNKIMDLLSAMIDGVETRIEKISPAFKLIDELGGRTDEKIAEFSINKARDMAWDSAEKYAKETPEELYKSVKFSDDIVSLIGHKIAYPGLVLASCLALIHVSESKDVVKNINTLKLS